MRGFSLFFPQLKIVNVMKQLFFILFFLIAMTTKAQQYKIRWAEIEIYPEYLSEYLQKAQQIGTTSMQKEAGVICLMPLQSQENPHLIRVLEIYADETAYQNHLLTPHFQTYKKETLPMVKSLKLNEMNSLNADDLPNILKKINQ